MFSKLPNKCPGDLLYLRQRLLVLLLQLDNLTLSLAPLLFHPTLLAILGAIASMTLCFQEVDLTDLCIITKISLSMY